MNKDQIIELAAEKTTKRLFDLGFSRLQIKEIVFFTLVKLFSLTDQIADQVIQENQIIPDSQLPKKKKKK